MLTGKQIREARALLRWGRVRFGRVALLTEADVSAFESSDGPAWLTDEQEAHIRLACEGMGIRFGTNVDGQPTAMRARTAT